MKPIAILKLGTTSPDTIAREGDCDKWMIRAIGDSAIPVQVFDILGGEPLPDIHACAGAVLTGSGAMVTERLPWSEATRSWLQNAYAAELPLFGICYGHQLLADALGGTVDYHPQGLEVGTLVLNRDDHCDGDPLFAGLPTQFLAHTTHFQSVLRLPAGAVRLIANDHDPNHAFRMGTCAWGVQFHPEFTESIMRGYIERRRDLLHELGRDTDALMAQTASTPHARALLVRFAQWTAGRQTHAAAS